MKGRTLQDVIQLARNGASLDMTGAGWTADDLVQIVRNASEHITIRGTRGFRTEELLFIARNGSGKVTFSDAD
jgi:hypothetical protein